MRWHDSFIAVDWGTTNRRAYRLDMGRCADSFEDNLGILSVKPGEFPAAAADIRQRLGDRPMLMAGMIGSSRGWAEAPYQPCPADISGLAAGLCWIEEGRIAVVPGLSIVDDGRPDVMRGEEVQVFGAVAAGMIPQDCFVGHPGTHNKWVEVAGGRVTNFQTVMTGELFATLRERGMLAEMLGGEVSPGPAFENGVRRGLAAKVITAELFSVRAGYLLGTLPEEAAAAFVSGLLIGTDMAVGLSLAQGRPMRLMGDPNLTGLYAAAAAVAGQDASEIDGEEAFLEGAKAIAGRMQ